MSRSMMRPSPDGTEGLRPFRVVTGAPHTIRMAQFFEVPHDRRSAPEQGACGGLVEIRLPDTTAMPTDPRQPARVGSIETRAARSGIGPLASRWARRGLHPLDRLGHHHLREAFVRQ